MQNPNPAFSEDEQELKTCLQALLARLKSQIDTRMSKGLLEKETRWVYAYKAVNFSYDENGAHASLEGNLAPKKFLWPADTLESLEESDQELARLRVSALEVLVKIFQGRAKEYLELFLNNFLNRYDEGRIFYLVRSFLKEIKEQPLNLGTKVELVNLVILTDALDFTVDRTHYVLRRVMPTDYEKEYFGHMPQNTYFPSAILEISLKGRLNNEIQLKVTQAIRILRLFRLSCVYYTSYTIDSEFVLQIAGTHGISREPRGREIAQIKEPDHYRLKRFWRVIAESLPDSLLEPTIASSDYLGISYQCYSDALERNGSVERRIANVVMGLEALFLKGGERQELIYRLAIRTAKVLSYLGFNPTEVVQILKATYDVRSTFLHGSQVSDKRRKESASSLPDILNYLRVSIISLIVTRERKEHFIDCVDRSLVSSEGDRELRKRLSKAKAVVALTKTR